MSLCSSASADPSPPLEQVEAEPRAAGRACALSSARDFHLLLFSWRFGAGGGPPLAFFPLFSGGVGALSVPYSVFLPFLVFAASLFAYFVGPLGTFVHLLRVVLGYVRSPTPSCSWYPFSGSTKKHTVLAYKVSRVAPDLPERDHFAPC